MSGSQVFVYKSDVVKCKIVFEGIVDNNNDRVNYAENSVGECRLRELKQNELLWDMMRNE